MRWHLAVVDKGHSDTLTCHSTYADLWVPSLIFVAVVMFLLYRLALRSDDSSTPR
jgi:hypothetical protein